MRVPESVLAKRKQNEKVAAKRNQDKIERKKVSVERDDEFHYELMILYHQ